MVALVTRGGASNCSAGVMAGSDRVMIDLTKMNRVLDIDPAARAARVHPGVINSDLQERLAPTSWCPHRTPSRHTWRQSPARVSSSRPTRTPRRAPANQRLRP
ncbi:FAD-binding protein [Mycobacterium terramassiliense]|uniref:FAD-binding oxidoreductase n=1 Tax=Mycobacterium terramassiliense TaxID=1841859 RepID=UPI00097CEBB3